MQTKLVISIVDDEESVRIAISMLVRSMGWAAELYSSAEAFLASDGMTSTACIISDIQMPGMSGIDLYRSVLERGVRCPAIFITGFPSDIVRRQADALGALCVLSKPVDVTELSRHLDAIRASYASAVVG